MTSKAKQFVVNALRSKQGDTVTYSFFLPGAELLRIAEISRIHRSNEGALKGFQRTEIKRHVAAITEFLSHGPVLFPNAIILAFSQRIQFTRTRGPEPENLVPSSEMGRIALPLSDKGPKLAWIVDGQQRSIALSKAQCADLPVPVVAFVSTDINAHREQFILVNKAKPLSPSLVDELLPETTALLPRDLSQRRIPAELCDLLNRSNDSPLYGLIKRPSGSEGAVINDRTLINTIKRSIDQPNGALAMYKQSETQPPDLHRMYETLVDYWWAVRDVFPDAWGRPPTESRLMHAAGIDAMSSLMDRLVSLTFAHANPRSAMREALGQIAPRCAWTRGRWPDINRAWDDIQFTPKDVKLLTEQLIRLEHNRRLAKVA